MKISGNYTLKTTPEVFWKMVMDPDVLEKVTPGIRKLKPLATDKYEAFSEVKVGPVKGEFTGLLSIEDKVENERCVLVVDQKSKMGNAVARIAMKFSATDDGHTQVHYSGDSKLSGMLARMGQRIMSGVVSTLSKQFFQSMEKELEERQMANG